MIIENRPYKDKADFVERSGCNKRIVGVLEKVGVFGGDVSLDDQREYFGY